MWIYVVLFFVIHWYLSLFCQTFFLHRYASHKQFTMTKTWEKFFYVFTWICQGSSYLSPSAYGIMHRMHHAYADTENDPHSPSYDANPMSMMWRTRVVYNSIFRREAAIETRFTGDIPEWRAFDVFASNNITRIGWIFIYIAIYIAIDPAWYWYLLLPLHAVMGPLHGVVINWFAHVLGYQNFKVNDTSKNIFPIDLLMLGEGLHNNHHKNAFRANFGWKKWEFDPTYPVIKALDLVGVISLRPVPA